MSFRLPPLGPMSIRRLRYGPVFARLEEELEKASEMFKEICLMYDIDLKCRQTAGREVQGTAIEAHTK